MSVTYGRTALLSSLVPVTILICTNVHCTCTTI